MTRAQHLFAVGTTALLMLLVLLAIAHLTRGYDLWQFGVPWW